MSAYFEDESYYTYGAFKHAVLKNQQKRDVVLTHNDRLCAYLENAGMFLNKLNTKKQFKYFDRCLEVCNYPNYIQYHDLFTRFKTNTNANDLSYTNLILSKTKEIIFENKKQTFNNIKDYFNTQINILIHLNSI